MLSHHRAMCATPLPPITTSAELLASGRTRRWIRSSVQRGDHVRLRRGVYAGAGACEHSRVAARHGGSLACASAARHLGIWVLDEPTAPHVWMGDHGHRRSCTQVDEPATCRCVEHWDRAERSSAFGLPSVPAVLRQLLTCYGVEAFFVGVESALNQGLLSRAGLDELRRSTNDAAREALDFAGSLAGSGLESIVRWRLRSLGVPVRSQVDIVSVGRVDLLFGDRLIVELDGRENHEGESLRHKDLARDANAAAWGYITLRFDFAQVIHDWETVEAAIRAQLDAGRHVR